MKQDDSIVVLGLSSMPVLLSLVRCLLHRCLNLPLSDSKFIFTLIQHIQVGPWILQRLKVPSQCGAVVDYFECVSNLPDEDIALLALPW